MAAYHLNNGLRLYGHHDESNRSCTSLHDMARFNGAHMTGWKPLRHHMNNLVQVLCQWLEKSNSKLTDSQLAGCTALRSLLRYDIPRNPTDIVAALDAIFFGDLLHNRLGVSVIDMGDDEGQTQFVDNCIPRTPRASIRVHNLNGAKDTYYRTRPQERRLRIVSTLIHEMCHAFILIYGCDGRECATKEAVASGRGFTGHGPAWVRVARAAEVIFTNRIVPMLPNVDYDEDEPLGIADGMEAEDEHRRKWF